MPNWCTGTPPSSNRAMFVPPGVRLTTIGAAPLCAFATDSAVNILSMPPAPRPVMTCIIQGDAAGPVIVKPSLLGVCSIAP